MKKYYNSPAADLVRIDSGDCICFSNEDTTVGIGFNAKDNCLDVSTWSMWEG